jgi:hypothetical protein
MIAWLKDPFPYGDRRLPHATFPPKPVLPVELQNLTGVIYFKV